MFVPGKLFQPSRMFAGKAGALPSEAPFKCKHWTRLEKLAEDKHSSLLQKSTNYGRNKFYSTGLRRERTKSTIHDRLVLKGTFYLNEVVQFLSHNFVFFVTYEWVQ